MRDGTVLLLARWRMEEGAPALPESGWWRLYGPLDGSGEVVLLAVPPDGRVGDLGGSVRLQASLYRQTIGARPGVDFLNGTGPVSVFGVDVDPDAEDSWNDWYDTQHLPAVLAQPGTVAGARYRLEARLREGLGHDPRYLVVYALVDVAAAMRASDPSLMTAGQRATFDDWLRHGKGPTSNALVRKLSPLAMPMTAGTPGP